MFNTSSKPIRVIDPADFSKENWHTLFKEHPALQWVLRAEQLPEDPQVRGEMINAAHSAIGRIATSMSSFDPVVPKPQVVAIRKYIQAAAGSPSSKL